MQRELKLHLQFEGKERNVCTISFERNGGRCSEVLSKKNVQEIRSFFERHKHLLLGEADPHVIWLDIFNIWLADPNTGDLDIPVKDEPAAYQELGFIISPESQFQMNTSNSPLD